MRYAINGKFLSQGVTGVQRYARELVLELDKIVEKNMICIVYASDAKDVPEYKNIEMVKLGESSDFRWLQFTFPLFCMKHGYVSINLCGSGPLLKPGIVCMHDVGFIHYPEFVSKKFYCWGKLQIWNSVYRAKDLITVSEFSKKDIESLYNNVKGRFVVIPNAWQHMNRVSIDDSIFDRIQTILRKNYYFSMSSLSPNKNLRWIVETAKLNSKDIFVVAGKIDAKIFGNIDLTVPNNVQLIGYITDEEAKSLMANCKAFIFPTFFEGFGIPPLEALACGCKRIIVSDTECMHEVYGDFAYYIDPNEPIVLQNLTKLEETQDVSPLEKYSWSTSAMLLKSYLLR